MVSECVEALDPRFWDPVVPGVASEYPSTRVGFDSQWALPMSCCFCMFCSSSLGILNQTGLPSSPPLLP